MTSDDRRRIVGQVVSVSADHLVVELNRGTDNFTVVGFDDIHYVARLGSFAMIPVQSEYVVGEVVGLREKDLIFSISERTKELEFDRATSVKFLDLVPIGMLPQKRDGAFRFGVSTFPSLYADALYIVEEELDRIFEVADGEELVNPDDPGSPTRLRALSIGTSAVFTGYDIKVRIEEYFGGHVAVLGNTGSGKSCAVATVVQSLFEKLGEYYARGATFFLLDVNGEYRRAFSNISPPIERSYLMVSEDPVRVAPNRLDDGERTFSFRLPHWFMSVEEWELLLRANERTQQPVLRTALGLATLFSDARGEQLRIVQNHILAFYILYILQSDASSPTKTDRISEVVSTLHTNEIDLESIRTMIDIDYGQMGDVDGLTRFLQRFIQENITLPNYDHSPFEFSSLGTAMELALLYEESHGNRQIRDYCAQLLTRYKWIREREEFSFLRVSPDELSTDELDIHLFVERFLGLVREDGRYRKKSQIVVLDMNEAADEVVEVGSAVIARLLFERMRHAEPRNRFPVNIVLEEAHRYVAERPSRYAIDASRIFKRVAKEGRKYAVLLTVASQRPSELSKTVLSQCANFVVHRIQNPDDLLHIRHMTPFISKSVLKRLPSLPRQHALIFGNAVNLPTTFRVREVEPRPKSDDAEIRKLWFRAGNANIELAIPTSTVDMDEEGGCGLDA